MATALLLKLTPQSIYYFPIHRATILMAVLLLIYYPYSSAIAASGGRMGGSSFSSSRSSSSLSSSSSRKYSYSPSRKYSYSPSYSYYDDDEEYPSYSSRSLPKNKIKKYMLIKHTTMSPGSGFSYSTVPPFSGRGGEGVDLGHAIGLSLLFILMCLAAFALCSDKTDKKTSVVKLQVGLSGLGGKTLQRDLNRIAETADTSTRTGLSYVLTETIVALLRHPSYCISGYTCVDIKRGMEDVETHFNRLSIEERGKFDEETLVNVNNIKRRRSKTTGQRPSSGASNDYKVITILVAAEGKHELPTIKDSADLKEALQKLGSLPSTKTLAVEVLWTPQNENDTLSEQELLEDYPLLRPL